MILIFIGWWILGVAMVVVCLYISSGSLFSILLLCRLMDIAYYMATTLISSNVYLMLSFGIFNVVSTLSIEGVCVWLP